MNEEDRVKVVQALVSLALASHERSDVRLRAIELLLTVVAKAGVDAATKIGAAKAA